MQCFKPIQAFWSSVVNPKTGKFGLVFKRELAQRGSEPLKIPCGQCIGCRLEKSRQWAVRCVHEADLHDQNCFITLTYNAENLPEDYSLKPEHFTKFMKRFRKAYAGKKIRYFMCGEYGDQKLRPHYHACIFGHDFSDKVLYKENDGNRLYISEQLNKLWPFGFSTIGELTFESAAYTARYVMKKVNGKNAEKPGKVTGLKPYERVDPDTGEVHEVHCEYCRMSRRPGIAHGWFERYGSDAYPSDFLVVRGQKMKPPRYYDYLYGEDIEGIKERRVERAKEKAADNTPARLKVKEKCCKARIQQLKRALTDEGI